MSEKKSTDFADSAVWKLITLAGNAIMLNLLFLVSCIPVVTIGPALCGLFGAVRYYARGDGWFQGYREGFKTNWWQMMIIFTVGAAAILFMGNDVLAIAKNYKNEYLTSLIPISVMLALAVAFVTSAAVYNVFFPRRFMDLLSESAGFVFKAPLRLAVSGLLFWAPPFLLAVFFKYFGPFIMVPFAVYFTVVAFFATAMLKDPLIAVLQKKRESGELPPKEEEEE